jgi:hypothetical protein
MPYLLRRILKTTALILVGAIAAGWPTGDDVAHARKCQQAAGHPVSLDRHRGRDRRQSGDRILRDSLMNWLATERGVHAETLLVSAGAIAGFAAQAAILERIKSRDVPGATKDMAGADLSRLLSEKGLAVLVTAKSGETYYFGDLINGYLVKQATTVNYHLFGILAAAIQDGVRYEELPDPRPMFRLHRRLSARRNSASCIRPRTCLRSSRRARRSISFGRAQNLSSSAWTGRASSNRPKVKACGRNIGR